MHRNFIDSYFLLVAFFAHDTSLVRKACSRGVTVRLPPGAGTAGGLAVRVVGTAGGLVARAVATARVVWWCSSPRRLSPTTDATTMVGAQTGACVWQWLARVPPRTSGNGQLSSQCNAAASIRDGRHR